MKSFLDHQVSWVSGVAINSLSIPPCSYLDVNIWNHIIKPSMGEVPYGWVSFARLDRLRVLQALYKRASGSSLKYTLAKEVGLCDSHGWKAGSESP